MVTGIDPDDLTDEYGPSIVARLKRGVAIERAQAELTVLYQQILAARGSTRSEEQQRRREHAEQKVELTPAGNGSQYVPTPGAAPSVRSQCPRSPPSSS